jgi:hypothetical protein
MKTVHPSAMCSNRNIKPLLHLCQTFTAVRLLCFFHWTDPHPCDWVQLKNLTWHP